MSRRDGSTALVSRRRWSYPHGHTRHNQRSCVPSLQAADQLSSRHASFERHEAAAQPVRGLKDLSKVKTCLKNGGNACSPVRSWAGGGAVGAADGAVGAAGAAAANRPDATAAERVGAPRLMAYAWVGTSHCIPLCSRPPGRMGSTPSWAMPSLRPASLRPMCVGRCASLRSLRTPPPPSPGSPAFSCPSTAATRKEAPQWATPAPCWSWRRRWRRYAWHAPLAALLFSTL